MTLPDPESAMAAKASVPSSSTILPIAGTIGYCYEFTAVASGINIFNFKVVKIFSVRVFLSRSSKLDSAKGVKNRPLGQHGKIKNTHPLDCPHSLS